MARSTKLTPVIHEAVVTILRTSGCSRTQAASHVGVDRTTFHRWMNRSTTFRSAVEKAENDFDLGILARVRAHATRDSRTAQWVIEHHPRLRAEWGTVRQEMGVTVVGPDGEAPSLEVKHTHGVATETISQLAELADFAKLLATADVLVRVGLIPAVGSGEVGQSVEDEVVIDAEAVEVHPA